MVDSTERKEIPFAVPYFGDCERINETADDIAFLMSDAACHRVSNGESCREFEERVAKISGADYAIATSSCTQAMMLMLACCTAKRVVGGFMPSFTWNSTLIALNAQKYEQGIKMMDIDYDTWTVKGFPVWHTPHIALAVDTFGNDTNPVSDIPLFFDRAHSLGVRFRTLGFASALSFSSSKIVTALEGGMILTNKTSFVKSMTEARDLICRMSEAHAEVGLHNLRHLPDLLEWKKETYDRYRQAFPDFHFQEEGAGWNHQVIGMLVDSHAQQEKLAKECSDIEFKIYYKPMHLEFEGPKPLPVTEDIYRRIVVLPSWYQCPREYIIRRIKEVLAL